MAFGWADMTTNLVQHNSVPSSVPGPSSSSLANGGRNGRVNWHYVLLSSGMTVIEPAMGFYLNPPPFANCRWSTNRGETQPINFSKNTLNMPKRELTKWDDRQLAIEANKYQAKYWEEMKFLVRPETFEDLYEFFDGMTMWKNGAYNMWNMLNMLVTHAHNQMPMIRHEWKSWIDTYVYEFLYLHPDHEHNQQALCQWNGRVDPVNAIPFRNWPGFDLHNLNLEQENMVREALICQHTNLTGQQIVLPQYFPFVERPVARNGAYAHGYASNDVAPQPASVAPANTTPKQVPALPSVPQAAPTTPAKSSNNNKPVIAVTPQPAVEVRRPVVAITPEPALTTSQPVTAVDQAVVAVGPPAGCRTTEPSAALTSISEEPSSVAAVDLNVGERAAKGVQSADSGKTTALTPEAQVAVPEIVTRNATPKPDKTIHDRKDGNNSGDDLSLNPDHSQDHLQVKGRPVDTMSAPEEELEAILEKHDAGAEKRSAREAPAVMSTKSEPKKQSPAQARGAGKPAAEGSTSQLDVTRQRPSTSFPPQRPMSQRVPPMGPSPPRLAHPPHHMTPGFGPANGMMPQPAGFHTSPPGLFPGPSGFFPHGPPPPPGVRMPPMGPPMEPFHNQMPARPPHMEQQQFHHPNGTQVNTPQFVGPHNQGPLMYQANGYVPQPQRHNGGGNGSERRGSHGGFNSKMDSRRRDSIHSSGSRKIRDDPIHGAVYSLKEARKGGHAFSGRRPSNDRKSDQERRKAGPMPPCNNSWALDHTFENLFGKTFNECTCGRCSEASRSVFVKLRNMTEADELELKTHILQHFAMWRPVEARPNLMKHSITVVFHNDLDAIRAVQAACHNEHKSIKNVCDFASVWYPFYSKHYTSRRETNPAGLPREALEAQNAVRPNDPNVRRDSNPFCDHQQKGYPNGHNFSSGPPAPAQQCFQYPPNVGQLPPPNLLPMNGYQPTFVGPIQQRTLWEPPVSPRRYPNSSVSCAKPEKPEASNAYPQRTDQRKAQILLKEDWRSKPPSEEAILDDDDNIAVVDTTSNHSSQSAKSVKVSLPNEEGSAREVVSRTTSRSVSPEAAEQALENVQKQTDQKVVVPKKLKTTKHSTKGSTTSSRTITPYTDKSAEQKDDTQHKGAHKAQKQTHAKKSDAKPATKDTLEKKTTGYRKTTADLTTPVESLEQDSAKSGYRKTTGQLSNAVETFDYPHDTIIRHKPSRGALPESWADDIPSAKEPSPTGETFAGSQSRFKMISLQLTAEQLFSAMEEHEGAAPPTDEAPASEEANTAAQPQPTQQPKRKAWHKKSKVQAGNTQSKPDAQTHSRGASPEFTRPPSENATSSHGPAPAMQYSGDSHADGTQRRKKNSKTKKRKPTQPLSEFSEGLAKSGGSQDIKDLGARAGSPSKKPKTVQSGQNETSGKAAGSSQTMIDKKHQDETNEGSYRANTGGSLRMNKQRSPKKGGPRDDKKDKKPAEASATSLTTIFEPSSKESRDDSPFAQQKLTIDKTKQSDAPPKMKLNSADQQSTPQQVGNDGTNASQKKDLDPVPQMSSNTKVSGGWAAVVKEGLQSDTSSDPSSAHKGETTLGDCLREKDVKPRQKETRSEDKVIKDKATSPPPSPKKSHRTRKSKSKLNAAVQEFVPSTASSASRKAQLNPTAQSFTSSVPISPTVSVALPSIAGLTDGSINVKAKEGKQPLSGDRTTPNAEIANMVHAKKPSLPCQPAGIDKRFVTPAEKMLDVTKVSQPAPPTKEKKAGGRSGPLPDRTAGMNTDTTMMARPQPLAAVAAAAQQAKILTKTVAEAASADAPAATRDNFPTLGEAAAAGPTRKRRAASIVKAGLPAVPRPVPAAASDGVEGATATRKVGAHSNSGNQRSVTAPAKPQEQKKVTEPKNSEDQDTWQTVGPAKKNAGGSSRGHRGGRGGGHRGGRGARAAATEERKGG